MVADGFKHMATIISSLEGQAQSALRGAEMLAIEGERGAQENSARATALASQVQRGMRAQTECIEKVV